jgi:hypothetical protein
MPPARELVLGLIIVLKGLGRTFHILARLHSIAARAQARLQSAQRRNTALH